MNKRKRAKRRQTANLITIDAINPPRNGTITLQGNQNGKPVLIHLPSHHWDFLTYLHPRHGHTGVEPVAPHAASTRSTPETSQPPVGDTRYGPADTGS